jgi:murein DD-endopeptidase MepM/ murein hydrolase activator NlpD
VSELWKKSRGIFAIALAVLIVAFTVVSVSPPSVRAQAIIADSFDYPIKPYVVNGYTFGEKVSEGRYHLGEDVKRGAGTDVYACADGVVRLANNKHTGKGNYGGLIIIEHTLPNGEKICSLYGHLDDTRTLVRPDSPTALVKRGQKIGELGRKAVNINGDTVPHLHFGLRYGSFPGEYATDPNTTSGWYWGGYGKIDPITTTNWWLNPSKFIEEHKITGLYAGSTNPGVVWQYKGGTNWENITEQPSSLGWSVTSITNHGGELYVSTISNPNIYSSSGQVWKYAGAKTWTPVSAGLEVNQVTFLIIYKGELYAGTATPARLYKYDPATTSWSIALEYGPWYGFRSACVWGNWLYLGEWYWDRLGRWNGTTFDEFQPEYWGSCIYNIEEYEGYLYAGAYGGSLYKITSEPPTATKIWNPPQWQYAWTLKKFKDYLYIGLDSGGTGTAPLYRYDGINLPSSPTWIYSPAPNPHEGIISMATDGKSLFVGVGGQAVGYPTYMSATGTGKVYRSSDGINFEPASDTMGTGVQVLYYYEPK